MNEFDEKFMFGAQSTLYIFTETQTYPYYNVIRL